MLFSMPCYKLQTMVWFTYYLLMFATDVMFSTKQDKNYRRLRKFDYFARAGLL